MEKTIPPERKMMTFDLHPTASAKKKYVTRYNDKEDCLMERLDYTVTQYGCNHIYHCIVGKSMDKRARLS